MSDQEDFSEWQVSRIDTPEASPAVSAQSEPAEDFSGWQVKSMVPKGREGLSPDTAINKSPLSLMDRAAISAGEVGGNQKGGDSYLKQKGFEVARDKDGNRVLRDPIDKTWKYADEQDAWTLSAAMGDIADITPDIVSAGAQGVATSLAALAGLTAAAPTGGASIPAAIAGAASINAGIGALAAKARISLGRQLGTYEADPEQEVKDLAFESLMSGLGGGLGKALEVGAKPTAAWIANGFKSLGRSATSESAKGAVADMISLATDVKPSYARVIVDNANSTADEIAQFAGRGISRDKMQDELKRQSVDVLKNIVKESEGVQRAIYKQGVEEVGAAAEATGYKFSSRDTVSNVITELQDMVNVKIRRPDGNVMSLPKIGTIDPTDARFKDWNKRIVSIGLRSDRELAQNPELSSFLQTTAGRDQANQFFQRQLKSRLHVEPKVGAEAAKDAMKLRQDLLQSLREMSEGAERMGVKGVARIFQRVGDVVDSHLKPQLDQVSGGAYSKYLQNYANAKDAFGVLSDYKLLARDQRDAAYEKLLTSITQRGGANSILKDSIPQAIQAAQKYEPASAKAMAKLATQLDVKGAAAQFIPWVRNDIKRQTGALVATGLGISSVALGGVATGGAALLGAGAVTSPALWLKGMQAGNGMAKMLAQSPDAIKNMRLFNGAMKAAGKTAPLRQAINAHPAIYSELFNDLVKSPFEAQKGSDELLQKAGVK
jgi:hypothetical protein